MTPWIIQRWPLNIHHFRNENWIKLVVTYLRRTSEPSTHQRLNQCDDTCAGKTLGFASAAKWKTRSRSAQQPSWTQRSTKRSKAVSQSLCQRLWNSRKYPQTWIQLWKVLAQCKRTKQFEKRCKFLSLCWDHKLFGFAWTKVLRRKQTEGKRRKAVALALVTSWKSRSRQLELKDKTILKI